MSATSTFRGSTCTRRTTSRPKLERSGDGEQSAQGDQESARRSAGRRARKAGRHLSVQSDPAQRARDRDREPRAGHAACGDQPGPLPGSAVPDHRSSVRRGAMHDRLIGALETCSRQAEMLRIQNRHVDWEKHQIAIPGKNAKDRIGRTVASRCSRRSREASTGRSALARPPSRGRVPASGRRRGHPNDPIDARACRHQADAAVPEHHR